MAARARVLVLLGIVASAAACGSSVPAPASAEAPPGGGDAIARLHQGRCGACHVRVDPGERSRAQLEEALGRHRGRVRMTEEQWGAMIDYLAAPGSRASHAATPPDAH